MSDRRRRSIQVLRLLLAGSGLALAGASIELAACVRHADIRDEPDASNIDLGPGLDAGDIPELDSGLGTDAYPPCSERPLGECYGTLDFPCGFEGWALKLAESCFKSTGCKTPAGITPRIRTPPPPRTSTW